MTEMADAKARRTPTGVGRSELLRVLNRKNGVSIVDDVIVTVGTDIIEGRLKPGADLNSVELAKTFGVSRTPIREALLTLEREGFVEISAHRRPRVAPLRIDEVRELYHVRAALYAMISRAVVEVATNAGIGRLDALQHDLRAAAAEGDVDAYFWLNVQFRNTEAELSGNETLRRILDSLGLRMLQLRHVSLSQTGRLERSVDDHERLLRAYWERNADLAAALTSSLVLGGLVAIERYGWPGILGPDEVDIPSTGTA